jgi:hypothetical protein
MAIPYTNRSAEDLVSAFAKTAAEHGHFTAACDPKRANAKFRQMAKLYGEIRRRGITTQCQLLTLLSNDDPNIRFHAASYALDFEPTEGEKTLTEILETQTGALRLDARMTLEQWRKGEIRFSWVP